MSDHELSSESESQKISRRAAIKKTVNVGLPPAPSRRHPHGSCRHSLKVKSCPFNDMPEDYSRPPARPGGTHFLDTRQISSDSFYTDNQDFYVVQHYGQPELDLPSYRLQITGLVDNPIEYSLADLQAMPQVDLDAGFECGGNRPLGIFQGLIGNANWRGVRLRDLLEAAGIQPEGKEIVFFGGDIGVEEIRETEVEQAFARSLPLVDAMRDVNMLALQMNGEALPQGHGRPVRLLVPGFTGWQT